MQPGDNADRTGASHSPDREFTVRFCEDFEGVHGRKYIHGGAKDGTAAKAILNAVGLDEPMRLVPIYLKHDDDFYRKQGHSIAFMRSQLNALRDPNFGRNNNAKKTFSSTLDRGLSVGTARLPY
ncbi:MAG: hypothetical protein QM754_12065 [Tepidisphaeraceae bacterium]